MLTAYFGDDDGTDKAGAGWEGDGDKCCGDGAGTGRSNAWIGW